MVSHKTAATCIIAPLMALLFLFGPSVEGARAQAAIGVQGNWGSESEAGIGARLLVNIPGSNFETVGSVDRFFPENDLDWWDFNANVLYHFHVREMPPMVPYLGAGLNVARVSYGSASNSKTGLNLAGGLRFPGNVTPFVELRAVVSGRDQFVVTGGLLFGPTLFR